jgi:hypothetical protein
VRIDRLSLHAPGLIFSLVKRGNTESERTDNVTKFPYQHPTPAQLYALELSARRERAQAQARLIRAGVSAVKALLKSFYGRAFSSAAQIQRQVAHHA